MHIVGRIRLLLRGRDLRQQVVDERLEFRFEARYRGSVELDEEDGNGAAPRRGRSGKGCGSPGTPCRAWELRRADGP